MRNRLAELILAALHNREARDALEVMAAAAEPRTLRDRPLPPSFPAEFFERDGTALVLAPSLRGHGAEVLGRARRAAAALSTRPFLAEQPSLDQTLMAAGWLFDARLYFEAHEHLEPHWREASGEARESLQGLIQAAVGFEHLAGGNATGAVALLHDGCARLLGRRLAGRDLDAFAHEVKRCLDALIVLGRNVARFDWDRVPRFPGPTGGSSARRLTS